MHFKDTLLVKIPLFMPEISFRDPFKESRPAAFCATLKTGRSFWAFVQAAGGGPPDEVVLVPAGLFC